MPPDASVSHYIDKFETVICQSNGIRSPVLSNTSQLKKRKYVLLLHSLLVGKTYTLIGLVS